MEVESYYMRLQTVDDVSQFIYNIGFPNYVQRFIDNQIDGKKLRLMSSEQLLNLNISVRDVSLIMKRIEQDYPVDESTTQKKQRSDIVMEDGRPTLDLVWMRRGENSTRDPTWKKKAVECQRWQDQVGPIELLQDSMGNPFPRIKTNTLLSGKTILCTLVKPMDDGTFREFSNQPDYLKGNEAKVVDGCADFEDLRYLQTSCVKNSWERWMLKFEVINELYIEPVYSTPFRVRTTSKQFLCSEPIKILSISPEVGCTGQPQEVCVTGIFPRGPTFSIFFGRKEAVFSKGKNLVQLKGSCESSIIVNVQDECLGSVPVRIVTKEPQLPCNDSKIFTFTGEDGPGISFEDLAKVEADGYACGCPSVTLPITKDTVVDDEHDPDKGHSPLHWAAGQGKVKLVEYLVDKRGANVNSRDYEGATPLFWAVWTGSEQCVAFLLKKGANVNTPNYMGFTPLHLSACRGYANITQMLLYYKADGNCVNTFDEVPLSFATDSSIKRLLSTLENPLASPKSQTAAVLTTGPSILNPQQQQSQQLHQPQQHDSNPSDKRVRTDPTGIPLSNNNNHTSSNMMGGLPVRSVQPTNSTTVQSKQMETSRPPLTDAALNAALANSPGWGYGSTPSKSDCTILLANKVIADINMLTQYLETTDPQLLMSSHVPTAHYIMQQFVSGLISAQAQTQAQAQTPGVPAIKSATAASNPFGGPAPSSMFSSPFMPSSAFATTTTPSNGNNNMPSSPFSPQGMTTTTGPTSSMFAPSNQYGIPQTIKTGLGGSSTPYNVQPLASPTTPTITASPSSTQLKSPSTSTASTNPFAASNLVQPIPMQLSMFKPIARGPLNQSNDVDLSSSTLLDFDFLEVLGTGTFAKVQLCKHKVTKKHYCMKILNKAKIVRLKQVDHVANEKNVLRRISHPNIVKLFRCFKDRSNLYLLLEFVPGGELFNYIRKSGRLPNDVARIYAAEIIMAFEHLHSQRIVYRDLKPENLLLDDYGHIKLTDFGFAKEVRERTYSVCGTPEYIAPEIILNKGHDMAVDWWSLGILIFEMLAGYPPFSEDPASKTTIFEQILYQKVEIPEFFHPHARDLIVKLLEPDSSARMAFVKSSNTLKGHEWFGGLDWQGLYDHRAPGPLNPEVVRDGDTHNFYKYSDVEMQAEELDINVNYDQIFADF